MPEPLSPNAVAPTPKTADDINELFKTLDTEEVDKKPAKTKEESEDKDKSDDKELEKLDDEELELIEDDEDSEKLDLTKEEDDVEIDVPPRKREILKKYPEIYKDFPFLEKMMYRDKQYTELFGSFDDAKEVAEKAETFTAFESQLLSGNTEEILKNIKEADGKAFDKVVDSYLKTLHKVDKDAYFEVAGNLVKQLIMDMVSEANSSSNDDLKNAALLVNQFMFGSSTFAPPKARAANTTDNDEKTKVEEERLSFIKERFETSRDELQGKVDNILRATISEYIDPKQAMSSYVKKNAVSDTLKYVHEYVHKDASLTKNLDRLWKQAFDAKFTQESLRKIQSFYLSMSKRALPLAIKKARSEALKDSPPRKEEKEEIEETPRSGNRRIINAGRPSQRNEKDGMKKGESVTDFFMRD